MLWLWNRMAVLHSGLCLPSSLVPCYCSLLWEVLFERSKGESRPCSFSYCCFDMLCCSANNTSCTSFVPCLWIDIRCCNLKANYLEQPDKYCRDCFFNNFFSSSEECGDCASILDILSWNNIILLLTVIVELMEFRRINS